jgi:hypothetical protein
MGTRISIAFALWVALAPRAQAGDSEMLDRIGKLLGDSAPAGTSLWVATTAPKLSSGCDLRQASPARPLVASGRIALRLEGRGCPGWIWADVQIRAPRVPPSNPAAAAGSRVRILVQVGSLMVEEVGRLVPCSRGLVCAVVPSGKHVEGRLDNGTLVVEPL